MQPVFIEGRNNLKARKVMVGIAVATLLAFASPEVHAGPTVVGAVCKATKKKGAEVSRDGTDGSSCDATNDGTSKSKATARGDGSLAESTSDKHGKAKSTATGGGNAQAAAFGNPGKCKATANASGAGSTAIAQCQAGGFAFVTATSGETANGWDDKAPQCDPGGHTTVHSSGGNC